MASEEFRLVSPTIDHEGKLPRKYTKEGQGAKKDISPPLEWYNVPEGTKSLALVVEDIDAPDPSGPLVPWTVWVVVDIPTEMKGFPEGYSGKEEEIAGIREGNNDHKVPGWRGPLLPSHGHRFQFKLFALDDKPSLGHTVTKERLLDAIEGHVLGEAILTFLPSDYTSKYMDILELHIESLMAKGHFLSELVAKCEHEWEEVKEEEKSTKAILHRSEYLHHLQHVEIHDMVDNANSASDVLFGEESSSKTETKRRRKVKERRDRERMIRLYHV